MAARENALGQGTCPLCNSGAEVRLSSRSLPYLICGTCHMQAFARSHISDRYMRDLIRPGKPAAAPAAAPEPAPFDDQAPAAPAAAPADPKPEPARQAGASWGFFR